MDYSPLPLAVAIAAASLALNYDTSTEYAQHKRGRIRFRPGRYLRVAFYIGLAIPVLAMTDMVRNNRYAEMLPDWPLFTGITVVVLGMGYGWPRTISLETNGIRLSSYLGFRSKYIRWKGAHAVLEPGSSKVVVCGLDGTQIEHTKWHVARQTFVLQLTKHMKVYEFGTGI